MPRWTANPVGQLGPCDMCCHARFWVRAPQGSLLLKACLFSCLALSCSPGIAALWGTQALWGSQALQSTSVLPDTPPWLGRSTPPWTTTRRPWLLWAFRSQPPLW